MLFVALLIAYPWVILTAGTLAYLASLPFGWLSYRRYERKSRESRADAPQAAAVTPAVTTIVHPADHEDRPTRLN